MLHIYNSMNGQMLREFVKVYLESQYSKSFEYYIFTIAYENRRCENLETSKC